jgi:hypothetical protein
LLLPEGHTWDEVTERIECSRGFVASWSKRFAEQRTLGRTAGLADKLPLYWLPELKFWLAIALQAYATNTPIRIQTNGCYAGYPTFDGANDTSIFLSPN